MKDKVDEAYSKFIKDKITISLTKFFQGKVLAITNITLGNLFVSKFI
jgi:hypothetical protein